MFLLPAACGDECGDKGGGRKAITGLEVTGFKEVKGFFGEYTDLQLGSVADVIRVEAPSATRSGNFWACRQAQRGVIRRAVLWFYYGRTAARGMELEKLGVRTVGSDIDNDIAFTDYSIGFDTAVNNVDAAVNCATASHERV